MKFFSFLLSLSFLSSCSFLNPTNPDYAWKSTEAPPKRLLLLVLGPVSSGALAREDLVNFKKLQSEGLVLNNARIGHFTSQPIVSMPVISTGLFPKNLRWSDTVFFDSKGLMGKKNQVYRTTDLNHESYSFLFSKTLPSLFGSISGTKETKLVIADTPSDANALAIPNTETRVLSLPPSGSQKSEDESVWVKNTVLSFFDSHPDWTAILARLGSFKNKTHLEQWDEQLGQILNTLEKKNLLAETMIVVTSEQGKQSKQLSSADWIFGKSPSQALPHSFKPLELAKNIQAMVQDSSIRFYMKNQELPAVLKFCNQLRGLPSASEIYYKKRVSDRYYYIRSYRSPRLIGRELDWAKENHNVLLQTMANETSADVVVFFEEQEQIQRIPMILWSPNLRKDNPVLQSQIIQSPVRLVDIHPMVQAVMKRTRETKLDGTSWGIEGLVY